VATVPPEVIQNLLPFLPVASWTISFAPFFGLPEEVLSPADTLSTYSSRSRVETKSSPPALPLLVAQFFSSETLAGEAPWFAAANSTMRSAIFLIWRASGSSVGLLWLLQPIPHVAKKQNPTANPRGDARNLDMGQLLYPMGGILSLIDKSHPKKCRAGGSIRA